MLHMERHRKIKISQKVKYRSNSECSMRLTYIPIFQKKAECYDFKIFSLILIATYKGVAILLPMIVVIVTEQ